MTNLRESYISFITAFTLIVLPFVSLKTQAKRQDWKSEKARIERALGISSKNTAATVTAEQVCAKWNDVQLAQPQHHAAIFHQYFNNIIEILPSLYKNKNQSYGALNLAEMFRRFQNVRIFHAPSGEQIVQADIHRRTDFYLPSCQIAVFNQQFFLLLPAMQKNIIIHVYLGASGYEDNNYQLTMALLSAEKHLSDSGNTSDTKITDLFPQTPEQLYWRPNAQVLPNNNWSPTEKQIFIAENIMKDGGFTGSGGGGDGSSAFLKELLLKYTKEQIFSYTKANHLPCHQVWSDQITYKRDIQKLKIESNRNLLAAFSERRSIGSYWIRILPVVYGEENQIANLTALDIFNDYCTSLYGQQR